ncbi:hypothetical protein LAWI1_G001005 [Lachnellula willkommii]|uniref:Zn(2)-C6 fungal-type domain-containing protein n=1 Tax=Lachnellula willkommii TaxID=215461 RepID=A0A559MM54_9HELO|nr:hypothetical protein LAWI1_G001005 [Lachnellula willkommii]
MQDLQLIMHRVRKVKCDQGWPACDRCISTGRVCDGYGIWGGGGNAYCDRITHPKVLARSTPMRHPIPSSVGVPNITPEEQGYLEWFLRRSVVKLPGIFGSEFWGTLVLQTSSNEPAVFHAVLALSAVHKRDVFESEMPRRRYDILDEQEQFALRQYTKAVGGLKPYFSAQIKESLRTTLIACLVFVSLEFLHGHYKTGNIHLHYGLKLVDYYTSPFWPSCYSIDHCIIETFARLQLQVQMLGLNTEHIYNIPQGLAIDIPTTKFHSVTQARQKLDCLLKEIFHLTQLRRQTALFQEDPPSHELLKAQSNIRAQLGSWFRILTASIVNLRVQTDTIAAFSYRFLTIYHTMAGIMVETCLETAQESIFEDFTSNFASLLAQAVDIQKALLSPTTSNAIHDGGAAPFSSIADIGWIPPLYYTALKCRVHHIRVHAIKLISSKLHKEGIWDSRLAGCIAREVMQIEEKDFYKDFQIDDDFSTCESPSAEDMSLPALPEAYRVSEVKVMLPDDPTEKVNLICRRQGRDGNWEIISKGFDVREMN